MRVMSGAVTTPQVDGADVLRLERCAGCGYQLAGLPADGLCPECGHAYAADDVVLRGWACGSRASIATGNRRVVFVWIVFGLLNMTYPLMSAVLRGWWTFFIIMAIAWLTLTGISIWLRWRDPEAGPIEVHFSRAGFRQVDGPDALYRPEYVPWDQADSVEITPARGRRDGERWRIRMRKQVPWWKPSTDPLYVEVTCTPAQAEGLQERITAWRAGSCGLSNHESDHGVVQTSSRGS